MTKVSVIIPAYNGDRYIGDALESVLAQTYPHYEIIVVDDGSTDNTSQIVQAYGDRVNYIYQENQGVAAARNQGIRVSTGEYIAFLDQDDFFLANKLSEQVSCLKSHPDAGIIHSGWQRVNYYGEILGKVEPWHQAPILDLEQWLWWKPVLLSAMMFQRQWLEKVQGLDSQFKQVCDLDLAWRLTLMGCKTIWLKQVTVCYREHDRNDSLNTPVQAQETVAVLDKFFASRQIPERIRIMEASFRYYTMVWCAWRLYNTGYLREMAYYLIKAFSYSSKNPTETVLHWIESFKNYAAEYGTKIDVYALTNSQQWQDLVRKYVLS